MRSYWEELCERGMALDATADLVLLLTVKALLTSRATNLSIDYISGIAAKLPKLCGRCGVSPF